MTIFQPQNLEEKEHRPKSSQAHIPTFWRLWYSFGVDYRVLLYHKNSKPKPALYHGFPNYPLYARPQNSSHLALISPEYASLDVCIPVYTCTCLHIFSEPKLTVGPARGSRRAREVEWGALRESQDPDVRELPKKAPGPRGRGSTPGVPVKYRGPFKERPQRPCKQNCIHTYMHVYIYVCTYVCKDMYM